MTVQQAVQFATHAHSGQTRKYTNDPYIFHPIAVMKLVQSVSHTPEMLMAAVLHDVVEDCDVSVQDICDNFGTVVGTYVSYLTDISTPHCGNRATRKHLDALHCASGPPEVHTIKTADIIHNTSDISVHDPEFWQTYRHEKKFVLDQLVHADPELRHQALTQLQQLW